MAKQSEPATLVAIFSSGRVTIGKPAQRTSVPVVWALHKGLLERKKIQTIRGKSPKKINKNITRYEDTYVSRKRSAKELRLMCSCFIATSVKII